MSTDEYPNGNDFDMDELFNREVNTEEAAAIAKRNAIPATTYTTNPEEFPVNVNGVRIEEKDGDGQPSGKYRVMLNVSGRVSALYKGNEVVTYLRFSLSPDSRPKKEYVDNQWTGQYVEGKDDVASRLYADAVSTFQTVTGSLPGKINDLVEFLKSYPVSLETYPQESGLGVRKIKAARKR